MIPTHNTSRGMDYSWLYFAIQLAIYHGSSHVLSPDGRSWEPMPTLDPSVALVAHLPSINADASRIVPIDMEFGAKALHAAMLVRRFRSQADKYAQPVSCEVGSMSREVKRWHEARFAIETSESQAEMAGVWEEYQDIWDSDLTDLGHRTLRLLKEGEA